MDIHTITKADQLTLLKLALAAFTVEIAALIPGRLPEIQAAADRSEQLAMASVKRKQKKAA